MLCYHLTEFKPSWVAGESEVGESVIVADDMSNLYSGKRHRSDDGHHPWGNIY